MPHVMLGNTVCDITPSGWRRVALKKVHNDPYICLFSRRGPKREIQRHHTPSLDFRPRRERRPGILCMRMREIIDNNSIIQIVKNGQSYKKEEYV